MLRVVAMGMCVGVLLTGCTWPNTAPTAKRPAITSSPSANAGRPLEFQLKAIDLHQARVPLIGDNSKVINLLGALRTNQQGSYTIKLMTSARPYGLEVIFNDLSPHSSIAAVTRRSTDAAVLFLALTDNAEYVTWRFPAGTVTPSELMITTADANSHIGEDVKALGKTQSGVDSILQKLAAKPYPA